MQINFFADKKNLLLLLDWINEKYDNPTKLDFWGNTLSDSKVQGGTYVIFKDICKPAEYENLVKEVILKRDLPSRELELDLIPSDDSFYELEDLDKHLHLPERSNVLRRSRIYLCSWYSDDEHFQIKKKHYNEIRRFIIKNSMIYREEGDPFVEYVLKLD